MNRRTIGIVFLSVLAVAGMAWAGFGLYEAGFAQGAIADRSEIIVAAGTPPPSPTESE